MIVQKTKDGSDTCFSEKYNQAYHSKHGAYREALEKHVNACKIQELAKNNSNLKLLDLCFGLGYNSFVAIDEALKVNPEIKIEIVGLENDVEILKKICEIEMLEGLKKFQKIFHGVTIDSYQMTGNCIQLSPFTLYLSDARKVIKTLEPESFDAIFFDPFSPSVCPELWTEEFISNTVVLAKPGAYISTYSCARIAKDNFKNAGCQIFEGPKAGRRTGGVLAKKVTSE